MFKRKDSLVILWLTFITVIAWIGFNIYHISVTSTISEELNKQIIPIDPNFDMNTITKLSGREKIEPLYEFNDNFSGNSATGAAVALVTPSVTPTASIRFGGP